MRDDRGYSYSRYNDMYNDFKKWYDSYKKDKNPLSYINQEIQYFKPVGNTVDWKDYEEKTHNPIRHKEWFGI
jgi:hypothetical protein